MCGRRLKVMIASLLPGLGRHGRLALSDMHHAQIKSVSAATIDRMLVDVRVSAASGRRRRVGFHSAIRCEAPNRSAAADGADSVRALRRTRDSPGRLHRALPRDGQKTQTKKASERDAKVCGLISFRQTGAHFSCAPFWAYRARLSEIPLPAKPARRQL